MVVSQRNNKIESGYFWEVPTSQEEINPLVKLWIIEQEAPALTWLAKDFQDFKTKQDEWFSWFTSETWEALEQRWENVSEIYTKFQEKNTKGANEIQEAVKSEWLWAAFEASMKKQLNTLWSAWQLVWQWAWAASDVLWEAIENTTQKVIPEEWEKKLEEIVQGIADTDTVQGLVESYQGFKERNPETASNLEATFNIGWVLLDMVWWKLVTQTWKELTETAIKTWKEVAEAWVDRVVTWVDDLVSTAKNTEPSTFAENISWIDTQTKNVLKNIDKTEYDRYVDIGKKAAEDIKNPTPMDIAWQEALDEWKKITTLKKQAGKEMGKIVKDNADIKVNTDELLQNYQEFLKNRFNVEIDPNTLKIKTIAWKEAKTSDIWLLEKLNDDMLSIITVDEIWIENFESIWKRISSNFDKILNERWVWSSLSADEKSLKGFIQGEVKNTIKSVLPDEYAEKAAEFAKLLDIETRLSKLLGDSWDKWASFIKSAYSLQTGARMRRLAEEIKEITWIDLMDKAWLAKFSMQLSGDVRQANLLKALDLWTGFTSKLAERAKKIPIIWNLAEIWEIWARKVFPTEKVGRQLTK